MLPVITAFKQAHRLRDVVVVADAGMVSEANKRAIEAEGLWFILGARIPHLPHVVEAWQKAHPGEQIQDGLGLQARHATRDAGEVEARRQRLRVSPLRTWPTGKLR